MTLYIEKLLHWLMPHGNWGAEIPSQPKAIHPWGQLYVHLYLGATLPLILLPTLIKWPLIGLTLVCIVGIVLPLVRELYIDKHPIKDLWVMTPQGIDCRSDILSCWIGSAPVVLIAAVIAALRILL